MPKYLQHLRGQYPADTARVNSFFFYPASDLGTLAAWHSSLLAWVPVDPFGSRGREHGGYAHIYTTYLDALHLAYPNLPVHFEWVLISSPSSPGVGLIRSTSRCAELSLDLEDQPHSSWRCKQRNAWDAMWNAAQLF